MGAYSLSILSERPPDNVMTVTTSELSGKIILASDRSECIVAHSC